MTSHSNHPFHLVNPSPWPLLMSLSLMYMLLSTTYWFKINSTPPLMFLSLFMTLMIMFQWWRDMTRESTLQGLHTFKVNLNMKWGMILFITSEILFFFSFFWTFFHSSLTPSIEIGLNWPPSNILSFNPFKIPLLNTIILLISGISITWCHHSILNNYYKTSIISLTLTILLGIYFSMLQKMEYSEASFAINDSVYGSTFFLTTGFHGLHVLIGSSFLMVCLMRLIKMHYSMIHHFSFEAAAWYWHFVDVVWIFLFTFMYWWPN
uniref:Cytochrome c oxidase subunit 3 n=1 Tax=Macrostemum floridum TaxID=486976 RepID=A0A7L8XGW9_9NEOP|nr:cytochrome c oxidase subunit III [Macrostemum floridum]QOH91257.1 cytochrome c oxidase subunit 3 [Macrostemum floridum]